MISKIVVLLSGRGSNLHAIIDAIERKELNTQIGLVISNIPNVLGLTIAEQHNIPTCVIDHTLFNSREEFEKELIYKILPINPDFIILAGFMRILTSRFISRFIGQVINIHPSLLPKFKGLHTHRRAIESQEKYHGASTHFVTEELDGGPVIAQAKVLIDLNRSEDYLAKQVLKQEHILYPFTIKLLLERRVQYIDNKIWFDGNHLYQPLTLSEFLEA